MNTAKLSLALCLLGLGLAGRLSAQDLPASESELPSAAPVQHWEWIIPQPHGNTLYAARFTHDRFLAVGSQGIIQTSPDGATWTPQNSGTKKRFRVLAESPSEIVAAGESGTYAVSTDGGTTWEVRSAGVTGEITSLAYGNGVYVAITYLESKVLASTDLRHWTTTLEGSNTLAYQGVLFTDSVFVTWDNNGRIFRSTDGLSWQALPTPLPRTASLSYSNGKYWAIGTDGLYVSTDLSTWQKLWDGMLASGGVISGGRLSYLAGRYVILAGNRLATSSDGARWSLASALPGGLYPTDLVYARGNYVAIGVVGSVYTSTNLVSWRVRSAKPTVSFKDITHGPAGFVGVGGSKFKHSPDGVTWTDITSGLSGGPSRVVYSNGRYLAVGAEKLSSSFDGQHWTNFPMPTGVGGASFQSIAWGAGRYVAVGGVLTSWLPVRYDGKIYWSADGANWTQVTLPKIGGLTDIIHDGIRFVAIGEKQTVVTSTDGLEWTVLPSTGKETLTRIVFDGVTYVAVSRDSATVYVSTDLQTWSAQVLATRPQNVSYVPAFSNLIYAGGRFVALGTQGQLFSSRDGLSWDESNCGTDNYTVGVAFDGSHYVVASNEGCLLRSEPVPAPTGE